MSQSSEVQSPKCDFCEHRTWAAEAKHGCKQCKAYFCRACLQQYHSRGPYREHVVLTIDEYQSDEGSICPDHNEALKLFCESCMESLCCECKFLGRHADHRVVHLQEYATELKGDFDKLLYDMSEQAMEGESHKDIDVTVGVNKILNNVQKSFAERKRTIDDDIQNLLNTLQRTWTELHKECDMEHSFVDKTLRSALANWKKTGDDVGSVKGLRTIISGLEVIKHHMFKRGDDDTNSLSNNSTLSVPFYHCIWRIPKGSTAGFEPVHLESSFSGEKGGRLVNISGTADISQEEMRLDDYILGRVKVKAASTALRRFSLLRKSSTLSSNQQVSEQLSTGKPSSKGQSLSNLSFVLGSFPKPNLQWQPPGISVSSSPLGGARFFPSPLGLTSEGFTSSHEGSALSSDTDQDTGAEAPRIVNSTPAVQETTFSFAPREPTQEKTSQGLSMDAPRPVASFSFGHALGGSSLGPSTSPVPEQEATFSLAPREPTPETMDNKSRAEAPRIINSTPAVHGTAFSFAPREPTPAKTSQGLSMDAPGPVAGFSFGNETRTALRGLPLASSTSAVPEPHMLKLGETVTKATEAQNKAPDGLVFEGVGSSTIQSKPFAETFPGFTFGTPVNPDTIQIPKASSQPRARPIFRTSVVDKKPQPLPAIVSDDSKSQSSVTSGFSFSRPGDDL